MGWRMGFENGWFCKKLSFYWRSWFYMHMIQNMAWSRKGEQANARVPAQRGTSLTIFGATYHWGLISLSVRLSSTSKKRNNPRLTNLYSSNQNGTKSQHYLNFILSILDELDKHDKQGCNLVMDNKPICHSNDLKEIVSKRGYHYVYLSPYPPFLNSIEEYCSKLKVSLLQKSLQKWRNGTL